MFRWRGLGVRAFGVSAFAAALAGCSIHPLPGDFSRTSTVDIVRSLRCEARDGVESLLAGLKPQERLRAQPIIRVTKIGYDFSFTINEANDAGGNPDHRLLRFQRSFTNKPSTLDLNGSADLSRSNVRTFTIVEPLTDSAQRRERGDL